jgi:hypothetical protein
VLSLSTILIRPFLLVVLAVMNSQRGARASPSSRLGCLHHGAAHLDTGTRGVSEIRLLELVSKRGADVKIGVESARPAGWKDWTCVRLRRLVMSGAVVTAVPSHAAR